MDDFLHLNDGNFTDKEKIIISEYWQLLKDEGYHPDVINSLIYDNLTDDQRSFRVFSDQNFVRQSYYKWVLDRRVNIYAEIRQFDLLHLNSGYDLKMYIDEKIEIRYTDECHKREFEIIVDNIFEILENEGYQNAIAGNNIIRISQSEKDFADGKKYLFQFDHNLRVIHLTETTETTICKSSIKFEEIQRKNARSIINYLEKSLPTNR